MLKVKDTREVSVAGCTIDGSVEAGVVAGSVVVGKAVAVVEGAAVVTVVTGITVVVTFDWAMSYVRCTGWAHRTFRGETLR